MTTKAGRTDRLAVLISTPLEVEQIERIKAFASDLWTLPNVIISPHSASTVAAENRRIVDIFLDSLGRFLEGRPLRNRFDHGRGY